MRSSAFFRFWGQGAAAALLLGLGGCDTLQTPLGEPTREPRPEDTLPPAAFSDRPSTAVVTLPAVRAAPLRPIWYYPEPEPRPEPLVVPAPPPAPDRPSSEYIIRKGDTLCGIARRFHLSLQELVDANYLDKGKPIYPGQRIILPGVHDLEEEPISVAAGGKYRIRSGDTLFRIARRHGTTVAALKSANRLRGDRILVGQTLRIPDPSEAAGSARVAEFFDPKEAFSSPQPYSDANGVYIVQRGDSLFSIAKKTGTTFSELQELNHIGNPRSLQIGQKLLIHPEMPVPVHTHTTTTQATSGESAAPMPAPEAVSPPAASSPRVASYPFLEDTDFFKEDIDTIPVVQIRD